MALRPEPIGAIPLKTARVARAAFPKGQACLRLRDELGTIHEDERFASLFPALGRPAEAPWRLALVTVLQFAEGLPNRQAADAVRDRLAWKYLLGPELGDPGFDFSILSDFRARLVAGGAVHLLLDALLERCAALGLIEARGTQRTDATHVLAGVRTLNRLECVSERLRAALNAPAAVVPDWLRAQVPPDWHERYDPRLRSPRRTLSPAELEALAGTIGADGIHLLAAIDGPSAPGWLREVPAVRTLRVLGDLPPSGQLLQSPYDPDARFARKRETSLIGYQVHLTETCDEDTPHLITQVTTVPGPTYDADLTGAIQVDLSARGLPAGRHLLDAGYVDAGHLLASAAAGIELVGPVLLDTSWQAAAGEGFDLGGFAIDWERRTVTRPRGQPSRSRSAVTCGASAYTQVRFDKATCRACPVRARCTRAATMPRQTTEAFAAAYAPRAGIEGTMAQVAAGCRARRARYRTLPRFHLGHVALAVAISLQRLDDWWTRTPRAAAGISRFAALAA